MSKVPSWLKSRFSDANFEHVEEAIRQAELKTSGEIVPVLVRRSSTVGHVPLILILLTFVVLLGVDLPFLQNLTIPWILLAKFVSAIVISRALSPLEAVTRWLTSKDDQALQVSERAKLEFYESNIKQTAGKTGVLLFVSLMERQAVVLADKAITDKLPPETWQNVIEQMLADIKNKSLADGITCGIEACGELLSQHFPREEGDVDELPNHLVIK